MSRSRREVIDGLLECATCEKPKAALPDNIRASEFYADPRSTTGLMASCKSCHRARSRASKVRRRLADLEVRIERLRAELAARGPRELSNVFSLGDVVVEAGRFEGN